MGYLPFLILFGLLALNIPVAYSLIVSAISYFLLIDTALPVDMVFQRMVASGQSFTLLAVPFFILAGTIMNSSGISRRLLNVADIITGRMRGGLAQSNVVLSTLTGGICGSQNADAAMEAKLLGTEMIKRGYSPGYTCALTATTAVISTIIPPGIGLILYALYANQSVGKMFTAGILPGLLLCLALMFSVYLVSRKRGYAPTGTEKIKLKEAIKIIVDAGWALVLPLVIILGVRFGAFTATEAGAVAVVYSLFVGMFVYKELKVRDLPGVLLEGLKSTSAVMLIVVAAAAFSYYLNWERIPTKLTEFIINISPNKYIFLLFVNIFLLIVGMFLEGSASLMILTPLLAPIAQSFGIDLIHFGIVMVLNVSLGGCTPPFGTLLFVTTSTLNTKFKDYVRECMSCIGTVMLVLILLTLVPFLSTLLPNLLF